jgi:hypothetical protein
LSFQTILATSASRKAAKKKKKKKKAGKSMDAEMAEKNEA